MKGDKGAWKEFLQVYDTKFGASMSDPAKRTPEVLRAFLDTFKKEEDFKVSYRISQFRLCHFSCIILIPVQFLFCSSLIKSWNVTQIGS